jgi:hypothetical protein
MQQRKDAVMKYLRIVPRLVIVAALGIVTLPGPAAAAVPDWKAVEQALGKAGQLQDGDVPDRHAANGSVGHREGRPPRLFYMHFWAVDAPAKLAQGLKAALDQTNSRR